MNWIWFIGGLSAGTCLGALLMAMLSVAKTRDAEAVVAAVGNYIADPTHDTWYELGQRTANGWRKHEHETKVQAQSLARVWYRTWLAALAMVQGWQAGKRKMLGIVKKLLEI